MMQPSFKATFPPQFSAAVLAITLSACGGGKSSPAPDLNEANPAPTSEAAVDVQDEVSPEVQLDESIQISLGTHSDYEGPSGNWQPVTVVINGQENNFSQAGEIRIDVVSQYVTILDELPANCNLNPGNNQSVVCNIDPPNSTDRTEIAVLLSTSDFFVEETVNVQASLSINPLDTNPDNNLYTQDVLVARVPNVRIELPIVAEINPGVEAFNFRVYQNRFTGQVVNVEYTFDFPASVAVIPESVSSNCALANQVLTCEIADLKATYGASSSIVTDFRFIEFEVITTDTLDEVIPITQTTHAVNINEADSTKALSFVLQTAQPVQ